MTTLKMCMEDSKTKKERGNNKKKNNHMNIIRYIFTIRAAQ